MAMANVAWRGRFDVGNVPRFGYCSAFEVLPKAAIAVVQAEAVDEAVAEASPNVLVAVIVSLFLPFFVVYIDEFDIWQALYVLHVAFLIRIR